MKRKMKKFNEGGETKYDKEDEGIFGGKVKYREDSEGRKFVAGTPNALERFPQEKRYYSVDDVKGKLSGLFGGKKETPKSVDSEPVGDANKSSSYNKAEEAPRRQMTDSMTNKPEPAGRTYLREEADIDKEEPKKKVVSAPAPRKSKIEAAAPAPKKAKASMDAGIPKDTKSTRMPSGYEKLDVSEKPSIGKDAKPVGRTRAGTIVKSSNEPNAEDVAAANAKFVEKMKKQNKENEATFKRIGDVFSSKNPNRSYKSGGSVRSSASKRADGCAIRGKTRA